MPISLLISACIQAANKLAAEFKHCFQQLTTVKDEPIMYTTNILGLPAPWHLIAHNPRNNRRTKRKK